MTSQTGPALLSHCCPRGGAASRGWSVVGWTGVEWDGLGRTGTGGEGLSSLRGARGYRTVLKGPATTGARPAGTGVTGPGVARTRSRGGVLVRVSPSQLPAPAPVLSRRCPCPGPVLSLPPCPVLPARGRCCPAIAPRELRSVLRGSGTRSGPGTEHRHRQNPAPTDHGTEHPVLTHLVPTEPGTEHPVPTEPSTDRAQRRPPGIERPVPTHPVPTDTPGTGPSHAPSVPVPSSGSDPTAPLRVSPAPGALPCPLLPGQRGALRAQHSCVPSSAQLTPAPSGSQPTPTPSGQG